jgi:signal transduction histidine kinase
MSIFKKILFIITFVLLLSLVSITVINFYITKRTYNKVLKEGMVFQSKYYDKVFTDNILNYTGNLKHIINSREFDLYSYDLQEKLIKKIFKNYSDAFPIINFTDNNNSVISYINKNGEIKNYNNLIKIKNNIPELKENPNKIFVSGVKYCDILKKPVIIFSVLKRNYFDEDLGFIFAITPVDNIVKSNYIKLTDGFIIRFLDDNDAIISSSNNNETTAKLKVDNPLVENELSRSIINSVDSFYYLKKTNYGKILISYSVDNFNTLTASYIKMDISIYLFIFFVAFIITYLLSKNITEPLKTLLDQIKEYGKGNYQTKIELKTNDEVSLLADSFNNLGDQIYSKNEQLLQINKNLEHRVSQEVKKNLEKEKLLLEKARLASMSEMMDAVAHQWKQPLSLINLSITNLQLKNELSGELSTEFVNNVTKDITSQIKHLVDTTDEFRQFFRPDKKKELVSIKKLVESTLQMNKVVLISNNIKTVVNIPDIEYELFPVEFKHVFINLISNAKDALSENRIKSKVLMFDLIKNSSELLITVTDNAGGIPKSIIHTLFDTHVTTKEKEKGTGIGLYMSKQIVEKLNGTISAENVEYTYLGKSQKGAKFTIALPLTE